jgi:hypothetical protein
MSCIDKKHKRIRLIAFLLINIVLISNILDLPIIWAGAETVYKIIPVPNEYQETVRLDRNYIIQLGRHNPANDNVVRYRTVGYRITAERYDLDKDFKSGSNASISYKDLAVLVKDMGIDNEGMQNTSYTIKTQDFIYAAAKLGINGEYVKDHDGAAVYLHNVFEAYKNNATLKSPLWGKQDFLAAADWSSTTKQVIDSYYNYKFLLTPNATYNVKVIAEDVDHNSLDGAKNKDGMEINNPLASKTVIYGEPYNYTLSASNYSLKLGGQTYDYLKCVYEYTDPNGKKVKNDNFTTSKQISFHELPNAKENTTLTIKLIYDIKSTAYKYRIQAIDDHDKPLGQIKGSTSINSGDTVKFSINPTQTFKEITYNYQNQWYFKYTDLQGNEVINPVKSGNISQKMPSAKAGSEATFYVYYSLDPKVTQPPDPPDNPTPPPDIPEIIPPAADSASMEFTTVITAGHLKADVRGAERFVAKLGIPTTESLYADVTAMEYLLGYQFEKKVGIEYFNVEVSKDFILQWYTATPASAGGPKKLTETVTQKYTVSVPRAYGYWEINQLECYQINHAVIRNYALPNGSITIYPDNSYYLPPSINVFHSSAKTYHILPPDEVKAGIKLTPETITAPSGQQTRKPSVPIEEFIAEAEYSALTKTGKAKVRSDYLTFHGSTVISGDITETEAPDINRAAIPQCTESTHENTLFKPDNIIEATKINGTYPTSGTITYRAITKINSSRTDMPAYIIDGLDPVVIHTPVVCNPGITADNDRYVQLLKPDKNSVQLVLDPDPNLSDFTVTISNTGFHSGKQGYFTRDFSKSLRDPDISYIAKDNGLLKNQVRFPFDLFIDTGKSNDCADDEYIRAGTWITIGRSCPRFYLPMTTKEGVYTVEFRTIAVNGLPYLTNTEVYANAQLSNYVATNTLKVEVSGRIYGLTVYDLTDYPMWEEAFRVPNSMDFKKDNEKYPDGTSITSYSSGRFYTYSLGINDQYGKDTGRLSRYTFPLVNGSHPKFKNQGILKTGYLVRFSLDTIGNMFSDACKISIKPNFYYVDQDGKNRVAVDLYYTEAINSKTHHLVKVGSGLDQTNLKNVRTGDLYLGIPEKELRQTASLRGMTFSRFTAQYSPMFNFSEIRLNYAFRTYVNNDYLSKVKSYASYGEVTESGITEGDILERMQRWYGQYYLPNEVHAVEKGFDVMDYADKYGVDYSEDFWLKEGYLIVNFTIETIDEDGSRRLSYINATNYKNNGNCSMWMTEGPITSKSSYQGPDFRFYAGDFIIYYADQRMTDDYDTGAVY